MRRNIKKKQCFYILNEWENSMQLIYQSMNRSAFLKSVITGTSISEIFSTKKAFSENSLLSSWKLRTKVTWAYGTGSQVILSLSYL